MQSLTLSICINVIHTEMAVLIHFAHSSVLLQGRNRMQGKMKNDSGSIYPVGFQLGK